MSDQREKVSRLCLTELKVAFKEQVRIACCMWPHPLSFPLLGIMLLLLKKLAFNQLTYPDWM
jgi:hypothetical protein